MKLRKLTLHNVRRFADKTAVLGPFGDGLTTITAENESGKSTFFGALHALFFYEYGSGKKELKDMQPYSGGAMRISAEIELDGADYLIEKVFNLKKAGSSATVTVMTSGTILKQADDAEQWIQQNILNANNGPFGLLWVRQGSVGVDASADGIETRRDVMSSVRGQIDAVTGGRRMDSIVQRCKQDLDAISTKQDKPKAGSPWKEAVDRVELLGEEQFKLARSVEALGHDLGLKKRVATRLRELQAPELREQRSAAIKKASEHLTATREQDRKIQDAQKDIQLLCSAEQDLERDIKTITDAQVRRKTTAIAIAEKETAASKATDAKTIAQDAIGALQGSIKEKEEQRRNLAEALQQARQDERETAKRVRLAILSDVSEQLKAPKAQRAKADAILRGDEITKAAIDRLSDLERRRDIAIETRKIHFARFIVAADTAHATINGVDIPNAEPRLIDQSLIVTLPGFGTIALQPAEGVGQGIADPVALQSDLDTDLKTLGFDTVVAAQQTFAAQLTALQDRQTAQTQIRALAPDGVGALETEWSALCAELSHPADEPANSVAEGGNKEKPSEAKEREISNLDEDLTQLRDALPALQEGLTQAVSALTEVEVHLLRLREDEATLEVSADENATLQALVQAKTGKEGEIATARTALAELQAAGSDLLAATAKHERAVQADDEDLKEISLLERELARLDGVIHTQSEGAVEEKLAEVEGKLVRAEERAAQFANHAKALKLLIAHLEAARADAQETYFEPVRKELLPLLRQLHAGAEFQIDPDKLLIETITRNGVTDKIEVLSGGAFEQIAILTRLAFARLFAKHGNHVPIILDDALVHTDDERISTMFNMLAQIARDQQIIVLSCRTRAFSDLGGARAFITTIKDGAEEHPTEVSAR
ncbi:MULTISPECIES: AAA family ATPase [Falsihalocynthiibacter]|uniref:AAA family ATPase n=1 Tax=Falsihalocynthiibacter TaxID=2854182 RepID=UPI003000FD1E